MFSKDPLLTLNSSTHSPHQIIPLEIKAHKTVLDLGCNTGMLGKVLFKRNILDGVDINSKALLRAKPYYRHLYQIDLSNADNLNIKGKYDYIVLSDILEHLPRPDTLLKKIRRLLNKNGVIICSLPNIARLEIRLQLLFGKFDYTKSGILNSDHLRFFTRKSAQELLNDSGFQVIKIIPTGFAHRLNIFSSLTAFQFVYLAKKNHE